MKQFVLIDGYTLVITQSNTEIHFSSCHSRSRLYYDDSLLIEALARYAQNERFWHCLQTRTAYEQGEDRFWVMEVQSLIADQGWRLPQAQLNWSVWELMYVEPFHRSMFLWHPGSYYRIFCMPYSTALKVLQLIRDWLDARPILVEGIEVLSETQWNARFLASTRPTQPPLAPQILADLEHSASLYCLFFEDQARLYTPNEIKLIRFELLSQMSIAGLLNRNIAAATYDRLAAYPNLQCCALQAEQLWCALDGIQAAISIDQTGVTLDWIFLNQGAVNSKFTQLCLQHFKQVRLLYPYTVPWEVDGKQYRLVTGCLYASKIVLLTVVEIVMPTDPIALFTNVYAPTYLELVAWAALESCQPPMENWAMAVDWNNREAELAMLGCDPSLPQADFFLDCLASHLARLWQNGDRTAFEQGLQRLRWDCPQELYFLYRRGKMLSSGTLQFQGKRISNAIDN
ncbi:hypothetical protein ACN4EG_26260 [Alkalinema pantanalense CENA528]|uniref:hypothetical protein n=1 Tax=Alkalinema pantanalense TaxID=1620705 RepID=UPI003D6DA9BE